MNFSINNSPSYASVTFSLDDGESIVTEKGAMISMSESISISTSSKSGGSGGVLSGVKRMFAGESFFLNEFRSKGKGEVRTAPALVGDITHMSLDGSQDFAVQASSYLASTPGIRIDTKWGGFKTFFGGEGLFMLKISGSGDLFVNSFGAIYTMDIDGKYTVDTGHIVAFPKSLDFKVKKVGSWKSTLLSGEGLVCEFSGKGKIYMQTHNPPEFGKTLGKILPPRKK